MTDTPNETPADERTEPSAKAESIEVHINGKSHRIPPGLTIGALLDRLKIGTEKVAVEQNREIVPKAGFDSTHVEAGDQIEIVSFIGGG